MTPVLGFENLMMNMRNITYPFSYTSNTNASILKVVALAFTNKSQKGFWGISILYNIGDATSASGFYNNTRNNFFEINISYLKVGEAMTDLWQSVILWCRRKTRKYG